jgi:hypothetical protein
MPIETDLAQRHRPIMPIVLALIATLLVGMGTMAFLVHRFDSVALVVRPEPPLIVPPRPELPPVIVRPVVPSSAAVVETIVDRRLDGVERRVDDIENRLGAASGEASHAEALLVTFAARRALDRGVALGYLEGILRERFGGVEPQAVATIISASRQPVTIEDLRDQLDQLSPKLSVAAPDESWWDAFRRELGGMIVVRKAETPSAAPVDRLARARDDLSAGHVDGALTEIARLPAQQVAQPWIASARRYVQARVALDRIETAALLKPQTPDMTRAKE